MESARREDSANVVVGGRGCCATTVREQGLNPQNRAAGVPGQFVSCFYSKCTCREPLGFEKPRWYHAH